MEAEARTLTPPVTSASDRAQDPCVFVIFGASGDLTRRKLLPALYDLAYDRRLPARFAIVGFSRTEWDDDEFRKASRAAVKEFARRSIDDSVWESFSQRLFHVSDNYDDEAAYENLHSMLNGFHEKMGTAGNRIYYLAVPPRAYAGIIQQLKRHQITQDDIDEGKWSRIIIEKPFGKDLASAQELNDVVHDTFPEESVYRIDHYLGKETVQNILVFRFANGIFEPVWNRRYIDHIQITVAEDLGVADRGGYYDASGALKDMVQNHMMQLLALTAMEPPIAFDGRAVRNEKVKVLNAVRRLEPDEVAESTVRGQFGAGWIGGEQVPGYREEVENDDSSTESFVALKLHVDSWRWAEVPFYLRTGKRMPKRSTEIAIQFKRAPHLLFRNMVDVDEMEPTIMTMRIQPNEGISMKFLTKVPGSPLRIRPAIMDFLYGAAFLGDAPDAYETLILDAMRGDATLFTRADEVEAQWEIMAGVLDGWRDSPPPELPNYEAGTYGPEAADEMIEKDGRKWRRL